MTTIPLTSDAAAQLTGTEIAVSDWYTVTQADIDQFADVTRDPDWMHIDPERARTDSPFGTTIAFGFQTMSMLTWMSHNAGLWPENIHHGINYGFERMRLMSPVTEGSRIRGHFVLNGHEVRPDGGVRSTLGVTVEIEGQEKPALVGEWVVIFYPGEADAA